MISNIYLRRSLFAVLGVLVLVILGAISYPFLPSPNVEGYRIRGDVKELSQNADLGVEFSQPMDKGSVEKNAVVEKLVLKKEVKELVGDNNVVDYKSMLRPGNIEENFENEGDVEGEFEWKGSKLVFVPERDLDEGEFYRVRIEGDARSLIQKDLGKDYEEFFKVVDSPRVVMATPSSESVVPTDARVTVQFNRPMVALTSIDEGENRLLPVEFEPKVKGRGKWLGTTAFQFIPEDLDYSTEYKVTVAEGARSIDGGQVDDGFELIFETPRPEMQRTYPSSGSDDNGINPDLFLVFNQKMDVSDLQRKIDFLKTEDEKTYEGAIVNEGEIGDGWKGVDFFASKTTEQEYRRLFEYDDEREITEDDREEMERMVTVKATSALDLGTYFMVRVNEGAMGAEGDLGLEKMTGFKFETAPMPKLVKTDPADGAVDVRGNSIEIEFNNPMDIESLEAGVKVEPTPVDDEGEPIDMGPWLSYDKHFYYIYPPLDPASEYVVKISGNVEDIFGQKLGDDVEVKFQTGDLSPSIDVESRDELSMLNGYRDPVFYVRSTNVDRIKFNFKALDVENFERMYEVGYWEMYGGQIDEPLTPWELDVEDVKNEKITTKVDFNELSGGLDSGIYYFDVRDATAPEDEARRPDEVWARQAFLYTKTALTYKSEPGKLLVWATDVESGQPIEGMQIVVKKHGGEDVDEDGIVWSAGYDEVAKGFTNEDGIVELDVPEDESGYGDEHLIYGYRDGDFTALHTNWNDGISPWNFNIESRYREDNFYAYIYTDRPIYRPGHKVYFKGIVRANDDAFFSIPEQKQVNVVVNDSRGNELMNEDLDMSENGTFDGELVLSESVPTGNFNIRVTVPGENEEIFFGGFKVAEYRKPDYKVEIETDKDDYVDGERAQLKVNVDYYFGAPLADAEVRWSVTGLDYFFNEFDGEWYSFSEEGYFCYWGCEGDSETVTQGVGRTNAEGELVIDLPLDITEKEMSQLYKLEVTAEDVTGRSVSNRTTFPVHKGEYYVGINNRDYVVSEGDDAIFDLVSVDFDGEVVGGKKARVTLSKREWNTVRKKNVDGGYYYTNGYEDREIDIKEVTTDSKGEGEVSFEVTDGGLYRAVVESVDSQGNKIVSGTNVYVGSGDYVFWGRDNNDRIELVADKQEYSVGDVANVLIKSPYQGVKALVTYERGGVLKKEVIDLESNSETLEIEITEEMVPNIFVSVVLVKGSGQDAGIEEVSEGATKDEREKAVDREIAAFKVGYTTLFVDTMSKKLDVEVSTDREEYGPRDEVVISIETKNSDGEGVPAEVSVAVVDESVLALTETFTADLINYFYRHRMLSVRTAHTLTKAMGRINVLLAAGLKGGGGGPTDSGGVRSEFKDSAHWEAVVETDANGKGEVKFTVPDNLTSWQILAIGVTEDTLVGSKKESFLVTKDVLVQPVLPRFMTVGDEIEVGVLFHNQTDKAVSDVVKMEAEGVEILAGGAEKTVRVGPGEKDQLMWRVKVLPTEDTDGGEAKFRFENKFDSLEMSLPVETGAFAEVVATAGVISDDGIWREQVYLPEVVNKELGGLEVQVSPTLAGSLGDGTEYLMRYPYGCSEQTASSLLPNLVLKRVLDLPVIDNELVDLEQLDENVAVGLQRLYRYQNVNGGWGLWEDSEPTVYLTAYVLYTMDAAEKAGYQVDQKAIADGVTYLRNSINNQEVDSYYRANSRAYALYVMAVLGQGDLGLTNNLYEKRGKAGIYGNALLAMTYHELLGNSDFEEAVVTEIGVKIDRLKNDVLNRQRVSAREVQFREDESDYRSFDSDVRTTAYVLQMMNKVDVENPVNDKIVRFLMEARRDGHWRTTQDTSVVLLALVDFLENSGELNPDFLAEVMLNDAEVLKMEFNEENLSEEGVVNVAMSEMEIDSEVAVGKDGDGKLYYDLVLKYFLPPEEVSVKDQGMTVSQQYFALDDEDELEPLSGFELGEVVKGKVVVVVPEERHYVVVDDVLPAGLEPMDFSLETTEQVGEKSSGWRWWNNLWYFNHSEIRDDRVLYFADYLPAGTYEIEYYARATSEGEFNDLPAQAFEMYTPEVLGHTAARRVVVER